MTDISRIQTDNSRILLEEDLCYKVRGVFIEVSKNYGYLYKEQLYSGACAELFAKEKIPFVLHPKIKILSQSTGKQLSIYIPDFLVGDKIIVELKALKFLPQEAINQLEQYLKASSYQIGFLVNFGRPRAQIIRRIYTNDRKPWFIRELSISEPSVNISE